MKIIVAIKQVPARDSQLRIAASGQWIEEAGLAYEINEPDAYALEAGLRLKEKHGGEVVALCAGPERVGQNTVSYTHLDVYKRQTILWNCPQGDHAVVRHRLIRPCECAISLGPIVAVDLFWIRIP